MPSIHQTLYRKQNMPSNKFNTEIIFQIIGSSINENLQAIANADNIYHHAIKELDRLCAREVEEVTQNEALIKAVMEMLLKNNNDDNPLHWSTQEINKGQKILASIQQEKKNVEEKHNNAKTTMLQEYLVIHDILENRMLEISSMKESSSVLQKIKLM